MEQKRERLSGSVERVVFHNAETGWCVLRVKLPKRRRPVTVVGHSLSVLPGESIDCRGEWTEHRNHGEHFAAFEIEATLPIEAHAAEKYLGSGLIKGIGPEMARRLLKQHGLEIFDIIESRPDLLQQVEGIGPSRAKNIQNSWREQKSMRGLMTFLAQHDIAALLAPKLLRAYGQESVEILAQNPYRAAREIHGFSFQHADAIAKKLRLKLEPEERMASALHSVLQFAISRGHCAYPEDTLLREVARVAGNSILEIESVLHREVEAGRLAEEKLGPTDRICVTLQSLWSAEKRLAQGLAQLSSGALPWNLNRARSSLDDRSLSPNQRHALLLLLSNKVSLLTGGPGTGKTTLIKTLWEVLSVQKLRVVCCAPTGRAAQRLSEAAGVEALTVHRLLGWTDKGFLCGPQNPLEADLLVVDEASMVGLDLMESLVQALKPGAALCLVGDVDQLPSVQAGRVLESTIEAAVFPHAHLQEVYRQTGGTANMILQAARQILLGERPALVSLSPDQSFHFVEARNSEDCMAKIERMVVERIPQRFGLRPLDQIQILCPMNKGEVGARSLNRRLQNALNPLPHDRVDRFGLSFAVGDKVIVKQNDYDKDVFNGDIGRVAAIHHASSAIEIEISGRRVFFDFSELDLLGHAFAITIHKSQGSEYEAVIIPLLEESQILLNRNLLYTAITRGRRLVVIVGSKRALEFALQVRGRHRHSEEPEKRWSALGKRLQENHGAFS